MARPYEAPDFDKVKAWRAKLLQACAKIETLPPSEFQTSLALLVSDVSHEMQGALMDYDTYEFRAAKKPTWGVYVVTGPTAGTWCQHVDNQRIEVDERTARTIAILFSERFQHRYKYEERALPSPVTTANGNGKGQQV